MWLKTIENWGGKRQRGEFNVELETKGMHVDLKSLLDDPERDMTAVFCLDDLDEISTEEQ